MDDIYDVCLYCNQIRGTFPTSYQKLMNYTDEVRKADSGFEAIFELDEFNVFARLFWTYGEVVRTYRTYLRRMIIIDATFLGGRSFGTLFSAVAMDADNHIFPVGFAIAQGEKEVNWRFIVSKLRDHVLVAGEPVIIMSDRNVSIRNVVQELLPHCMHSYCAYHIRGNNLFALLLPDAIQQVFHRCSSIPFLLSSVGNILDRGKVGDLFMTLSKVVTDKKFIETREKIRELSPRSHSQINNIYSVHWSEFQFLREGWRRYGVHTSNHVERWNGLQLDYRNQPIHVLVEKIRTVTMDRYKKYGDLARLLQGRVCSNREWFLQYKTI